MDGDVIHSTTRYHVQLGEFTPRGLEFHERNEKPFGFSGFEEALSYARQLVSDGSRVRIVEKVVTHTVVWGQEN